jgi:hypothetical protein
MIAKSLPLLNLWRLEKTPALAGFLVIFLRIDKGLDARMGC